MTLPPDPELDGLLDNFEMTVQSLESSNGINSYGDRHVDRQAIHAYVQRRVEEEREACAQIADALANNHEAPTDRQVGGGIIAEEIRARSTPPLQEGTPE